MFTANTMASVGEAIGMSLPGSASAPAVDRRRDDYARASGMAVMNLLKQGIRPRQIMTKQAFENAIAVVMALGGSTNAVLHLLAIAAEADVDLELDDFNKVAARVPHIGDTKPHGKYHMIDIDRVGGVPMVMKELLDAGLLHGDCITVTGRTVAENLAEIGPPAPDGEVIHRLSDPLHAVGGIAVLTGSMAPKGSVVKVAGHRLRHASRATPGCSTASRPPWTRSWPGRSRPATSSSSATRDPRGVRACGRCWP